MQQNWFNFAIMPFRQVPPGTFSFDTLKLMQAAFDEVCKQRNIPENDPRRAVLATIIIRLAIDGHRESLSAKALEELH